VNDIEHAAGRATRFGGRVVIDPFVVSGVARIALILDSVGAVVGLWEPLAAAGKANGHV
jgi:predicted enzyme related to lactoylglutathione lyase